MARLGNFITVHTGKLDVNASSPNGIYPFFTCAVEPLRIDTYSYDCECVLVAGNGDLNVKYYNGKFDAYQRTYIIESKDKEVLTVPYLYCFLEQYVEVLREQSIGGVIKYIKLGNLTEAEIIIPSIEEQNRIVAIIKKARGIVSCRQQQLSALDDLIKARFVEMFGDPHKSKMSPYIRVSNLTDVVSGGTPDRKIADYWINGTIPWVKTTELQNSVISEVEERITEKGLSESSAKMVPKSTILIAMYGQGKTRGMTGFLGIEACTNQACACLLPTNNINMQYLWRFLILSYDELRGLARGGNQPNLNAGMIKDFPILVPPMEKQIQFTTFVDQIDKSKSVIQKSLDETQLLFDSLMQEYFG